MANIETLISRYLDGELTPAEQAQFRRLLADSPDARALLREMTNVARAARRIPRMHAPVAPLEAKLFQRLQAEGLYRTPATRPAAPARATGMRSRVMVAAGLLLLLAVIGGGYIGFGGLHFASHAPLTAGFGGVRGGGSALAALGSSLAGSDADHGAMVNIPEVRLPAFMGVRAASAIGRSSHSLPAHQVVADRVAPKLPDNSVNANAPADTVVSAQPAQQSIAQAHEDTPPPAVLTVPPPPIVAGLMPNSQWIASFRGGVAAVNDAAGTMVRELDMKVGMQMLGGHKVSFIVGVAPAINETRRANTGVAMSSPALSQVPTSPDGDGLRQDNSSSVVEYERTVRSEPWFGVGYNYSVSLVKNVSIDPGLKAGASASTWRIGAELPVSLRMSQSMSIECAVSVARVLPRNAGSGNLAVTDTPDHFIYEESKQQASFTTFGVQLGIRLEIPAGR